MRKRRLSRRSSSIAGAAAFALAGLLVSGVSSAEVRAHHYADSVFVNASTIMHPGLNGPEAIANPDDITTMGGNIFVGFQNGVGPQGQPSGSGNKSSTVVEFATNGQEIAQWDVVGKCDGLTADPGIGQVIATVNEDANSSLYTIDPTAGTVTHYSYSHSLPSKGGTDAISIYNGMILISASAPGTTGNPAPQPNYPAVYEVTLDSTTDIASIHSLFADEAIARIANRQGQFGKRIHLALTDPDSNEVVPSYAFRFAGDFMLTSQGDKQQIFVKNAGTPNQQLSVLNLTDSVDDTAWPSDSTGAIYTTDNSDDTIYKVTGSFSPGQVFVADTPCDANDAPATCPGPGFPPNFLGRLNVRRGVISPVYTYGPAFEPQGMLFMP